MKVYYLEKASQNFDRKKKSFNYPDYVWEVGSVWGHSSNFYSDVILQAKLGNQNPTGLPVGVVSSIS